MSLTASVGVWNFSMTSNVDDTFVEAPAVYATLKPSGILQVGAKFAAKLDFPFSV